MISVQELTKIFPSKAKGESKLLGVSDISFDAADGKITGLLGANGAGKSTTLRTIMGLLQPDSGTIKIDGEKLTKDRRSLLTKVAYLPHDTGLYSRLSGVENIAYYASLFGMSKAEADKGIEELSSLLVMDDFIERPCHGFSQGQKTKVALARVLINRARTLILDEPTNGLDIVSVKRLRNLLLDLKDQGHCILVSSHIMQEIEMLCDHVVILDGGKVAISGTQSEIKAATGKDNFEDAFIEASLRTERASI